MQDQYLLPVEDNPDDELLTLRALGKHKLANPVEVVRDGAEAIGQLGLYAMILKRPPA